MKQLFKHENGAPFTIDLHDMDRDLGHTILFCPTRIGMSRLSVFTDLIEGHPGHPPATPRRQGGK